MLRWRTSFQPLSKCSYESVRCWLLGLGAGMRRRDFLGVMGGAAAAWPVAAGAQQSDRVRRVGVLMHTTSDEPDAQARLAAFLQGMQGAGWEVGRNLRIETRWSAGDVARLRKSATDLVAL